MSASPAIQLERLRIIRGGNIVIDDVTVSVSEGIITGLLGPSGCGKTTLMRTIVGNQKITAGTATVFGRGAGAKSLRRRIGYVTQSPSIYRDLTTVENVRYFAALYGIGKQRVHEVVEAVGLTGQKTDLAGNLSGGQQGRVSRRLDLQRAPCPLARARRAPAGAARRHRGVRAPALGFVHRRGGRNDLRTRGPARRVLARVRLRIPACRR